MKMNPKSIFIFLILTTLTFYSQLAISQTWTQLGPGAGGQERAVYVYTNPSGKYDFYVGSDVSGVWCALNVDPNKVNDIAQYNWKYISNNVITRFINKFTPASNANLLVGFRSGIGVINLNATSPAMASAWFQEDSWVSDMHVNAANQIYFTTGTTRITDESGNFKNLDNTNDLYIGTFNPTTQKITVTNSYDLPQLRGDKNVYCLQVEDNAVGLTDDSYLIGSDAGLYVLNYSQLQNIPVPVLGPYRITNYKVTSILKTSTANEYLITVHGIGLFKYNTATNQWTDLINKLQGIDGVINQSTYNYKDFKNEQSVQGFTKLIFVPGTNPGWILMNENNLVSFEGQNYYVGAFYTSDNNGTPNNEWTALNVDFGQNDWGWNTSTPCSNVNSTLLTPNNYLMAGKSGNLFVTKNPIVTSGTSNPLIVTWQQIYTSVQQVSGTCTQYKHKGYVNTAPKCVFNDYKNNLWVGMHDRLMWVAEGSSDYFKEVKASTTVTCPYSINISGIASNTTCPTSGINVTDCFYLTNNPNSTNNPNDLYAGIGSGYASAKGPGFVVKLNTTNNTWEPVGTNYFCGDPVKLIFSNTEMYVLVNLISGGSSLYWYNTATQLWVAVSFLNSPANFNIADVLINRNGDRIFALNGNDDAIYSFEKNGSSSNFTKNAVSFNTGATNVKCKQMALLELPSWSGVYKLIVGTEPKDYTATYNNLYLLNSDLSSPTPLNTLGTDFKKLYIDNVDNNDGGINFIDVNPISKIVYVSTVYYDGVGNPVAKLYKAPVDVTNKTIQNSSWIDITGAMPNKAVKYICSKGSSCGNEAIFCAVRGLGIWKLNVNAGDAYISVTKTACSATLTANLPTSWSGGAITYQWSNGQATQTVSGLTPGTYSVTVNTTSGCSGQAASYTQYYTFVAMDFDLVKNNSCTNSGTIKVIDNGVNLPLTYLWSNGQTTQTATGLATGVTSTTYTVTVSDASGCTLSKKIAVFKSVVSATATITPSACGGTLGGSIIVNNTSTKCTLPFQYKLNSTPYQLSNVFKNLAATNYSVTLLDNNGCSASITATVGAAPSYTVGDPAGTYTLNNSLSVSSNLILTGYSIYVANSSYTITVNSGTLSLGAGTILQACSGTWGGIIVKSGATLVMNDATIKDAGVFAITAEVGSTIQIKDCNFDNNQGAVLMQNGNFTNSYICGTTFNYTKLPEFAYNSIQQHIKIDNATNVVIGTDYTTTISNPNIFTHAIEGILIINADAKICNSNFTKIGFDEVEEPGVVIRYGEGIAENNTGTVTKTIIVDKYIVGSTIWPACSFDNMINGVVVNGLTNCNVSNNNFNFCYTGVSFSGNTNAANSLQVTANNFTNFTTGISSNSNKAACTFSSNLFNMKLANTPLKYYQTITYGAAAISVRNTNDPGSHIIANSNKINNTAIGIYLIGVKATALGDVAIGTSSTTTGNKIWFNVPAAQIQSPHRGVSLVNCKNLSVANNDIEWDYTPTATVLNTIKGIELKATLNSEVKENTITSMAAGVAVFGDCTGSKLLCNKMDACYHGVYLDPNSPTSLLSTQGVYTGAQVTSSSFDNKWTNNINTLKVSGSIWALHNIIWIYDPTANSDYNPSGASFVNPQPGNLHNGCAIPLLMNAQERCLMFGDAVGDSTATDGDVLEFTSTDKETFYQLSKQDTTILTKGVATDVTFHAEFDSLSQSNIGLYEEVKDSLAAGNNQAALQKLTLIVDQNLMEENKKFVSSVLAVNYNPAIDKDADTLIVLSNIALIHPFYGGEAVYWARAILNLDIMDILPPQRKAHALQQNNNAVAAAKQGILFPNPANDQVTFSFPNKSSGIITLKIQDKLGRTLQSYLMNNSQITFSTGNYSQGVYQVTIYENDIQIENHKLIIIKY